MNLILIIIDNTIFLFVINMFIMSPLETIPVIIMFLIEGTHVLSIRNIIIVLIFRYKHVYIYYPLET